MESRHLLRNDQCVNTDSFLKVLKSPLGIVEGGRLIGDESGRRSDSIGPLLGFWILVDSEKPRKESEQKCSTLFPL